jgi:RNA polymerase sigma-70 factor, ECF subfamily
MDSDAISLPAVSCVGADPLPEARIERSAVVSKLAEESSPAESTIDATRELSDEFLIEQLREGSHGALALLFRRYARMIRSVADRIVRDSAEAEDLVQEVFLFIFRKVELFDPAKGSARSWIVQVTYHRAIDRRRHLTSRHFYRSAELDETFHAIDEPWMETAFFERSIEGSLGTEMLSKIREALSIDQGRTIQLYFFDGYSFEEIAELTGQTVGNARNHYYRGLEKIRSLVFASELRVK